jgi:hypothetical protein
MIQFRYLYFFTVVDESTDTSDIAQLLIFVQGVKNKIDVITELFAAMKVTTASQDLCGEQVNLCDDRWITKFCRQKRRVLGKGCKALKSYIYSYWEIWFFPVLFTIRYFTELPYV